MAQLELIDSHVSLKQCKLAVHALHAHQSQKEQKLQESELLPGKEQNIWLNVTVRKIPSGRKFKPVKIPIAHPLVDPRTTPICLITKDPQREYKDLLDTHKIKFISRVVGIEKLKGKFKPFEARRMLLKENGLFLADERIIPLLPKLLGVKWFQAKKQPIPVCLKRKDLKGELERAIFSTYMNQNKGTCTSVKVGTLSQTPDQILANLKLALPAIAKNIQGGWDNIQAFHTKTNSSASLPIWTCSLDEKEGGRWDGLTAAIDKEGNSSEGDSDDDDMTTENDVVEKRSETIQNKGRKRAQDEDEPEKPKKKAKGVQDKIVAPPAAMRSSSSTQTSVAISTSPSKPAKRASAPTNALPKYRKRNSDPMSAPTDITQLSVDKTDTTDAAPTKRVQEISRSATVNDGSRSGKINASSVTPTKKKKKATDTSLEDVQSLVAASKTVPPSAEQLAKLTDEASTSKKAKKGANPTAIQSGPEAASPEPSGNASSKKYEKKKSAVDAGTAKTTHTATVKIPLTKEELKQKRGSGAGEKKKNKVKTIGGKSAKNDVLGKKLAQ